VASDEGGIDTGISVVTPPEDAGVVDSGPAVDAANNCRLGTCAGCCEPDGGCELGTLSTACGTNGAGCALCTSIQTCVPTLGCQ